MIMACLIGCIICTTIFLHLCATAPVIETDDYE